jgi:fructose-bisphosphate aldolase class II
MTDILDDAKANNYAVPSFNVWDMQSIAALRLAAEQEDAPVILAAADLGNGIGNPDSESWAMLALRCARESRMPIAIHLDHGRSVQSVLKAISLGFTSVMIDASHLPFEENVALTRQVVAIAHPIGVSVEAELGHVGMGTDELTDDVRAQLFTRPADAVRFVEMTGVDALAVAVGTLHGAYRFEPKIEWELLKEITTKVPAHIVLHGASDTPNLDRAVRAGVTKLNIGHEIIRSLMNCLHENSAKAGFESLKVILNRTPVVQKDAMVVRLRDFGASGKGRALAEKLANRQVAMPATATEGRKGEFG